MDIIKSGGYKISALEIEKEILDCPDVVDVSVVGVPCEKLGEKIAALVSVRSKEFNLKILSDFLKTRLAPYKQPKAFHFVDSIPRNALGKVNKKDLVKFFD